MMTQQQEIVKKQYSTDEYLRIRQETHDKYTVPNVNFSEWALKMIAWKGDERVLDVGCGNGIYYTKMRQMHPHVQYFGIDLFEKMLESHPSPANLSQGDVASLPFANATFDVVMANHVLFHIDDIDSAVKEIRRVLKPTGVLMATTNSVQNMQELQVLMRRAIVLLSRSGAANARTPSSINEAFALENGTRILARNFYAVVRHDLPSALVFQETEPAMAYLESTREMREGNLPADVEWDDVMVIMRQQINQLVKHLGELVINKQNGVLLASNEGGFIREFLSRKK
jgi:2-polyprenyl-3-methyl-5-hydroxy-6-metoxy-1,4-benzoquinol methylase